jgi:hypothetical protein
MRKLKARIITEVGRDAFKPETVSLNHRSVFPHPPTHHHYQYIPNASRKWGPDCHTIQPALFPKSWIKFPHKYFLIMCRQILGPPVHRIWKIQSGKEHQSLSTLPSLQQVLRAQALAQ